MSGCPCCEVEKWHSVASWVICANCEWEDDKQSDFDCDEVSGGPNGSYSLTQARENFRKYGCMYAPEDPDFDRFMKERMNENNSQC